MCFVYINDWMPADPFRLDFGVMQAIGLILGPT